MPKAKLLIAEDDVVLRNLYRKKFALQEYTVREATDGEEAIRMLREEKPDLLILDIRMPKINGIQVLREFPKKDRGFPIVIVTNFYDSALKEQVMELGADEYCVKKDTTMKGLLEVVQRLLKRGIL